MRTDRVTTVAEFAGAVAIVVGAAMLSAAAGWIIGGVFGLWYAKAASR
jgi:hypothetical protein